MNPYTRDYHILGVPENCSLEALKAARRRLVKSWHPDRFPSGSEAKRRAEDRIKDINTAFEHLIDHYKKSGTLPNPFVESFTPAPPTAADHPPHETEPELRVDASDRGSAPPPRPRPRSGVIRTAVLLAAVLIGAETGRVTLTQNEHSALSSTTNPTTEKKLPVPENPSLSTAVPKYFTFGSTLGEVYAIQGAPAAMENGVWRYGKSSVYFANGVVTSWDEDPDNPLKTTLLSNPARPVPETFTVGSTKAEVRALEGTPLVETDTLWDYGLSKVHFRDGLVIEWESSPMRPLKARRP